MGPLAQKVKDAAMAVQKYEDAKASEITALEDSNKDLKARALELETAVREKDKTIVGLKDEIVWFRQKLLDAGSAKTALPAIPEPPREVKPLGAGKTAEQISKMAMAAVVGDLKERR
jgi:hypothetical protein